MVNIARECDPTKYNSSDIMRAVMATVETLFIMDEETQIRGLSYIFYCKGLTFSHARLFSPLDMGKYQQCHTCFVLNCNKGKRGNLKGRVMNRGKLRWNSVQNFM